MAGSKSRGTKRVKMGRPPVPPEQRRNKRAVVMLTATEFKLLDEIAADRRLPMGTVLHELVARALKRAK